MRDIGRRFGSGTTGASEWTFSTTIPGRRGTVIAHPGRAAFGARTAVVVEGTTRAVLTGPEVAGDPAEEIPELLSLGGGKSGTGALLEVVPQFGDAGRCSSTGSGERHLPSAGIGGAGLSLEEATGDHAPHDFGHRWCLDPQCFRQCRLGARPHRPDQKQDLLLPGIEAVLSQHDGCRIAMGTGETSCWRRPSVDCPT